jgi:hypothetical protein
MADNTAVININDFDASKLKTGNVRDVPNAPSKTCYVSYNGGPLRIQTPLVKLPFGISRWPKDDSQLQPGQQVKWSMDMSLELDGERAKNPALQTFYDAIVAFDRKMIQEGVANSMNFFKTKYSSEEVVEALYTASTKNKNPKYAPSMTVKVPMYEGEFSVKAYDASLKAINFKDALATLNGAKAVAIIQCTGLWLAGKKFGATWKLKQIMIKPGQKDLPDCAFIETPEFAIGAAASNSDAESDSAPAAAATTPVAAQDEGEEEDEEAPVVKSKSAPSKPARVEVSESESEEEEEEVKLAKKKPVAKKVSKK